MFLVKKYKIYPRIIQAMILGIFLASFGACDKNGEDPKPVEPIDSLPIDSLPIDTLPNDSILLEITQSVSSIVVDENNTKWIGTSNGLYKSVSGGYIFLDTIGETAVNTLMYEPASNLLWVGTGSGILKLTLSESEVLDQTSIPSNNLSHQNIRTAYLDSNSNRWFGTDLGLTLNHSDYWKNDSFRINSLNKLFPLDLETMEVNSISSWDGDYFFATNIGTLYRAKSYNPSVDAFTGATQWIAPYNGQNLTANMNVVFVDSKGNQWMGGESGIQVHKGHDPKNMEDFAFFNDELVSQIILTISEAPDGKVWVGTDKGISVYNGATWTTITENLPDLFVKAIAFDETDGSAWIGTKQGLVNIK